MTPSDILDLRLWNISIPVQKPNGTDPISVFNLIGYEHPQFFFADAGGVYFVCPVNGHTTKNSKYPRAELRELDPTMLDTDDQEAYWNLTRGGHMEATLKVLEQPTLTDGTAGRIVIGQIHGNGDELIRLYYLNGEIYFRNDKAGPNDEELTFYLENAGNRPSIPLGDEFSYVIDARGNRLFVSLTHNGTTYVSYTVINDTWQNDNRLYFKAGCYLNCNDEQGFEGQGGVAFNALSFHHDAVVVPPVVVPPDEPVDPPADPVDPVDPPDPDTNPPEPSDPTDPTGPPVPVPGADWLARLTPVYTAVAEMESVERRAAMAYLNARWP